VSPALYDDTLIDFGLSPRSLSLPPIIDPPPQRSSYLVTASATPRLYSSILFPTSTPQRPTSSATTQIVPSSTRILSFDPGCTGHCNPTSLSTCTSLATPRSHPSLWIHRALNLSYPQHKTSITSQITLRNPPLIDRRLPIWVLSVIPALHKPPTHNLLSPSYPDRPPRPKSPQP
jgi:hypothetical protein